MTESANQMHCLACDASLDPKLPNGDEVRFCPACGYPLDQNGLQPKATEESLPPSHPDFRLSDSIPEGGSQEIGRYRIIGLVGKGGMGTVYLAYDPVCRRRVALKEIKPELAKRTVLYHRFLREAWITSQLTHPGVIPIYTIHAGKETLYYTMPYVQGNTLKQVLRNARRNNKSEQGSIPTLTRVFLNLCQIVAYAHSRGVLHRDLKPENVMLGAFGEVFLLDWGLAGWTGERTPTEQQSLALDMHDDPELTSPGKIFGTVAYLAPERATGSPTTAQTDIYALGVILYQILCLRLPFKRESIKALRKMQEPEKLINPAKRAPYRNVPTMLARIAKRCLDPDKAHRYQSVQEILHDLASYIEGRSEWFSIASLDNTNTDHWEFQENVYLSPKIAYSGEADVTDWVNMMVSKQSFPGNLKLSTRVRIGADGKGIGFLICVPEPSERRHPNAGYCLWLGSDAQEGVKLFRTEVQVLEYPDLCLKSDTWYSVRIEYVDNSLTLFLDDTQVLTYVGHLPLAGTHVGLLARDANFEIEQLQVAVGSYRVRVNCLAVPDAFLAAKDYARALREYRRIAYSFPDRDEGREARFRAGITLLEEARRFEDPQIREEAFNRTLEEFELLHATPGAPLEYLGKALVYQTTGDSDEEAKCFDLAFRRYPGHPLLPLLEAQVLFRLHAKGRQDRWAIYRYILLTAQHLIEDWQNRETEKLVGSLERHWERLPFFNPLPAEYNKGDTKRIAIATQLAHSLAKPYILAELTEQAAKLEPLCGELLGNALFALVDLGSHGLANSTLQLLGDLGDATTALRQELTPIFICHQQALSSALRLLGKEESLSFRVLAYLMEFALRQTQAKFVPLIAESLPSPQSLSPDSKKLLDGYLIWGYLLERAWDQAGAILEHYPVEELTQEDSILHTLYGCWLANTEGEEIAIAHFSGVLDVPYPRSWVLLGHYLTDRISQREEWETQSFLWEKRQLYRQLHLYHHCLGEENRAAEFQQLEKKQYICISE